MRPWSPVKYTIRSTLAWRRYTKPQKPQNSQIKLLKGSQDLVQDRWDIK